MSNPKIILNDKLQETIAFNQDENCGVAKDKVLFIDNLMSTIINGHPIYETTEHGKMKLLQQLLMIKEDYQSFIVE